MVRDKGPADPYVTSAPATALPPRPGTHLPSRLTPVCTDVFYVLQVKAPILELFMTIHFSLTDRYVFIHSKAPLKGRGSQQQCRACLYLEIFVYIYLYIMFMDLMWVCVSLCWML